MKQLREEMMIPLGKKTDLSEFLKFFSEQSPRVGPSQKMGIIVLNRN